MSKKTTYLDYAAATPIDERVLKAMLPYLEESFYNPSALYEPARAMAKDLDSARRRVASVLGVRPTEIIFLSGGTEANNLAISGIMRQYPGASVVISAIEHESIAKPAAQYDYLEAPVRPDGIVDIEDMRRKINDKTVLVSIIYANNEIGTVQPVRDVAATLEKIRAERRAKGNKLPLYLHADACQAANYLDLHAARLGVDMMTLNSGKIYGPKQCGALYVKAGTILTPIIHGGGQEMGLRSGTENLANIVGFGEALVLAQSMRHAEVNRLQKLQKLFVDELTAAVPGVALNGSIKHRLPNNVHITIEGQDNERLLILLDENGIFAAAGSACSASKEESSHVLKAIGLSDAQARASLRFSMGRGTTAKDISRAVQVLAKNLSK